MATATPTSCYRPAWRPAVRVAARIVLPNEERKRLRALVRSRRTSVRSGQHARIVLLAAAGGGNKDIVTESGVGRVQDLSALSVQSGFCCRLSRSPLTFWRSRIRLNLSPCPVRIQEIVDQCAQADTNNVRHNVVHIQTLQQH